MKTKILNYIEKWEKRGYPEGIPDEAPAVLENLNKVPSYRKIVLAIVKNDVALETLGYSKNKCNSYNQIKRAELLSKGKIKPDNQLKLF